MHVLFEHGLLVQITRSHMGETYSYMYMYLGHIEVFLGLVRNKYFTAINIIKIEESYRCTSFVLVLYSFYFIDRSIVSNTNNVDL